MLNTAEAQRHLGVAAVNISFKIKTPGCFGSQVFLLCAKPCRTVSAAVGLAALLVNMLVNFRRRDEKRLH